MAQSSCCWDGHTRLSNGYCYDTIYNHIIRVSCTDKEWGPGCPQYCIGKPLDDRLSDMRQCNSQNDKWVCGRDVSSCLNNFQLKGLGRVDDGRPEGNIILAFSPSSTACIGCNGTVVTSCPSPTPPDGNQTGAVDTTSLAQGTLGYTVVVGLGLGLGLPFSFASVLAVYLYLRLHRSVAEAEAARAKLVEAQEGLLQDCMSAWQQTHSRDSAAHDTQGVVLSEVPGLPRVDTSRRVVEMPVSPDTWDTPIHS